VSSPCHSRGGGNPGSVIPHLMRDPVIIIFIINFSYANIFKALGPGFADRDDFNFFRAGLFLPERGRGARVRGRKRRVECSDGIYGDEIVHHERGSGRGRGLRRRGPDALGLAKSDEVLEIIKTLVSTGFFLLTIRVLRC